MQGDFKLFKKFVLSAKFNDWNDLLKSLTNSNVYDYQEPTEIDGQIKQLPSLNDLAFKYLNMFLLVLINATTCSGPETPELTERIEAVQVPEEVLGAGEEPEPVEEEMVQDLDLDVSLVTNLNNDFEPMVYSCVRIQFVNRYFHCIQ